MTKEKSFKKSSVRPGFEPGTSRFQSKRQTSRPKNRYFMRQNHVYIKYQGKKMYMKNPKGLTFTTHKVRNA